MDAVFCMRPGYWQVARPIPPSVSAKGLFVTNERGNLAHKETGDENIAAYAISHAEGGKV